MTNLQALLTRIADKKKQLDSYGPLPQALSKNLYEWHRIALTYTSNAIEGNTLTHQETALVVEKGITIGGKSLTEHLEAKNHAAAIDLIVQLAKLPRQQVTLGMILEIHRCVLQGIDNRYAGVWCDVTVRISGSMVTRPNPVKVPVLMQEFITWLVTVEGNEVQLAADAHLKFVFIHPFVDGNGRTARLLMNLLLLQEGYPLVIISNEKRLAYINAIEDALLNGKLDAFYDIVYQAVEESLDRYLDAAKNSVLS